MDFWSVVQTVLVSWGLLGAFGVFAVFVAQRYVDHVFSLRREQFLGALQRDIELFRSELQKASTEHEVVFRRFEERRSEAIMEAYDSLGALFEPTARLIRGLYDLSFGVPDEKRLECAIQQANSRCKGALFFIGRLYVPHPLWQEMKMFYDECCQAYGAHCDFKREYPRVAGREEEPEFRDRMSKRATQAVDVAYDHWPRLIRHFQQRLNMPQEDLCPIPDKNQDLGS